MTRIKMTLFYSKKRNVVKTVFKTVFLSMLLTNCSGSDGMDGVDGINGLDGEVGSANVIYSNWFPSQFPDEILNFNLQRFWVDAPDLTTDILDQGVILVFGRYSTTSSTIVEQLPFTSVFRQQMYIHSYILPNDGTPARVNITVYPTGGGVIGQPLFDDYRYVIIPGGLPTTAGKTQIDHTKMSYEEMIEHFGITD
ncbi:MAG: hypothetical protein AAF901_13580 [Bacteroidota bacterium]